MVNNFTEIILEANQPRLKLQLQRVVLRLTRKPALRHRQVAVLVILVLHQVAVLVILVLHQVAVLVLHQVAVVLVVLEAAVEVMEDIDAR